MFYFTKTYRRKQLHIQNCRNAILAADMVDEPNWFQSIIHSLKWPFSRDVYISTNSFHSKAFLCFNVCC